MKKYITSILCITLIMSLAGCVNPNAPEQTAGNNTKTTAETSVDPSEGTTATVTNPAFDTASACIQDKVEKLKMPDAESYGEDEDSELEYHIPQLLIKSSYADKINKEISGKVEKYKKNLSSQEDELITHTDYAAFLTKEGVLSIVFFAIGEWDLNEYKVYNIDVKTGEKVDNARIAEIAGVSSIREAAMEALEKFYNDTLGIFKIVDHKVIIEEGERKDVQQRNVEMTFSERYLNDKMQIGLTDDGKMFFITMVDTTGGAEYYDYVFDVDGIWLDVDEKAFVPVEDDGDEDYDDINEDDWTDEADDSEDEAEDDSESEDE